MTNLCRAALLSAIMLSIYAGAATPQPRSLQVPAVPHPLHWINEPAGFELPARDTLSITSQKNTDWFASPLDSALTATAPKLVFEADEDFVLTSKVAPEFQSTWDAGVLLIYVDERHWAKFCFEMTVDKKPSIVTVVTQGTSDDSVSISISDRSVYMRIAKLGNVLFFYVSQDGRSWQMVRSFRMENTAGLQAGFSSQSPVGAGCKTLFSEIQYSRKKIKDIFHGE